MKKIILYFVLLSTFLFSCKADRKTSENTIHPKTDSITAITTKSDTISSSKSINRPPLKSPIQGIDISHFQGTINWDEIKENGISYVYIKASEGNTFKDPRFTTNRSLAKKHGVYRGAYHFYETGINPITQAQNFVSAVKQIEIGDLPPVLDLEQGGIKTTITKERYQKNTLHWLHYVEKKLGVTPIIYCSANFGNEYLNNPKFAKYKLWIAEYTQKTLYLPYTWKKTGWTFWQRTDLKKLKGVNGDVDYDLFNGDSKAFYSLVKQ